MRKPKRNDVVPGAKLIVRHGKQLVLDAHLYLSGIGGIALSGTPLRILTGPRKKDGINLVRVSTDEYNEYECFYCDVLSQCDVA